MSNNKVDFLRFNAYSIKELITRKLSEDTKFTDQIYEGSNLATLIDMVSYMYQCLLYQLNNAASESMFADTQLYENITRLCNFIGYHPRAYIPSTLDFYLNNSFEGMKRSILNCTAFDTGMTDSRGNKIYFSKLYNKDIDYEKVEYTSFQMVNGVWKVYPSTLYANGTDYETFVLDINSDSDAEKYVADGNVKVFVIKGDGETAQVETDWEYDPNELFIQSFTQINSNEDIELSRLYNNDDKVYSIKLNENKQFEIKFGNGIVGRKLQKGDKILVMYLDSNGPDGDIDISQVDMQKTRFLHSPEFFNLDKYIYDKIFNMNDIKERYNIGNDDIQNIIRSNGLVSLGGKSSPRAEESVEDIRNNAPNWFKSGNRLITKKDYEYYFKANTKGSYGNVIDAKCMNNWEYMTTYYRWLYNMGINPISYALTSQRPTDPYRYLEKNRLVNNGFEYVDSADANNIYLWIKYEQEKNFDVLKNSINGSIQNIKTMTTETYPLRPIDVYFDISFTPDDLYYYNLIESKNCLFDLGYSYLEITMADNSIYSNSTIANNVVNILISAFDVKNCTLGQKMDYESITNQIYSINGVERVRTVFYPGDDEILAVLEKYKQRHCDGVSFASWSNTDMIDLGDDLQVNNTSRQLEEFQFPQLSPSIITNLASKIKVIKKTMNTTNPVKF